MRTVTSVEVALTTSRQAYSKSTSSSKPRLSTENEETTTKVGGTSSGSRTTHCYTTERPRWPTANPGSSTTVVVVITTEISSTNTAIALVASFLTGAILVTAILLAYYIIKVRRGGCRYFRNSNRFGGCFCPPDQPVQIELNGLSGRNLSKLDEVDRTRQCPTEVMPSNDNEVAIPSWGRPPSIREVVEDSLSPNGLSENYLMTLNEVRRMISDWGRPPTIREVTDEVSSSPVGSGVRSSPTIDSIRQLVDDNVAQVATPRETTCAIDIGLSAPERTLLNLPIGRVENLVDNNMLAWLDQETRVSE